jgi:hypothetical protein
MEGIGLYTNLLRRIPENDQQNEELMGYDLIGVEMGWRPPYLSLPRFVKNIRGAILC